MNMADLNEQSREVNELTITVKADMSEAIAGFKALQRELRETTKAAKETEKAFRELEEQAKSYVRLANPSDKSITDDIRRSYE